MGWHVLCPCEPERKEAIEDRSTPVRRAVVLTEVRASVPGPTPWWAGRLKISSCAGCYRNLFPAAQNTGRIAVLNPAGAGAAL